MPAISATAPGKIILFGEHAVVYGKPAIAVPVTQVQAKAIITPDLISPRGSVQVDAPVIELDSLLNKLPLDHAISQAVNLTLEALKITEAPAFKLRITSTIPLAAGLGSGAAVSVSIARAVSSFHGHPLSDEIVNQITFEVEKIHHNTPSGIDNTVITYAMPVYFVKENTQETFNVKEPFEIVIGDTGVKVSTARAVNAVKSRWRADRDTFYHVFAACGLIADKARQLIESGLPQELGPLMDENQEWLAKMGVSSPELERLIAAAREAGALGAKLSGGGLGGNMIALADPELSEDIALALKEAGATNTIVTRVGN